MKTAYIAGKVSGLPKELYTKLFLQKQDELKMAGYVVINPVALIVDCVIAGCPEGGVVIDPFIGAGTTAIVARKLNRNYVGIDLNEKYIKIANKRQRDQLGLFV